MMKDGARLYSILFCAVVILAPIQPIVGQSIENRAREITVNIDRDKSIGEGRKFAGSGVIIGAQKNWLGNNYTYYVLTANHVVPTPNNYQVQTSDRQKYPIDFSKVRKLPGGDCVDLAVLEFNSKQIYQPVKLEKSLQLKKYDPVYLFGWEEGTTATFAEGKFIDSRYPSGLGNECESLAIEFPEEKLKPGMSGGPILDRNGDAIGIFIAIRAFGPARGTSVETFLQQMEPEIAKIVNKPFPIIQQPGRDSGDETKEQPLEILIKVIIVLALIVGPLIIARIARGIWRR